MGTFKQYISETKGRLALSLQSANTYLSSDTRRDDFLNSTIVVEEKSNGIKLNLIKKANTGRAEEDYILAYENKIIHPDEFSYNTKANIRKNSRGISQLALVWEHLKKIHKSEIPIGTELFLEFSMNTKTSNGDHGITLIGHAVSVWVDNQGKLLSKPGEFSTNERSVLAEQLNVKTPVIIYEGGISTKMEFSNNIINKDLKNIYRNSNLSWGSNTIKDLSNMFLEASASTAGVVGVVIKYNDVVLKLQNSTLQESITSEYVSDEYNNYVNNLAKSIIKGIHTKVLSESISQISENLKSITDSEYNLMSLKEDVQVKARDMMSLKMPGNRGVMFLGKFKELTEMQNEVISEALIKYDTVTIALLSSKDTKGTKASRNNYLKENYPTIEIINTSMTNIDNIIAKSHNVIGKIITEDNMADIQIIKIKD